MYGVTITLEAYTEIAARLQRDRSYIAYYSAVILEIVERLLDYSRRD